MPFTFTCPTCDFKLTRNAYSNFEQDENHERIVYNSEKRQYLCANCNREFNLYLANLDQGYQNERKEFISSWTQPKKTEQTSSTTNTDSKSTPSATTKDTETSCNE